MTAPDNTIALVTGDEQIRLLLVEDDIEAGTALKAMLEKRDAAVTIFPEAEESLSKFSPNLFDIVVADIRLEGMSGVDLLRRIRNEFPDFPVILLTGYDSMESAVEAVRLGAQDYILKPLRTVDDLLIPVKKAVKHYRLSVRNRILEQDLKEKELRFRSVLDNSIDIAYRWNVRKAVVDYISPSCRTILGSTREHLKSLTKGELLALIHPEDKDTTSRAIAAAHVLAKDQLRLPIEVRVRHSDGAYRWLSITHAVVLDEIGDPAAVVGNARDITESRQAEESLRHSHEQLKLLTVRLAETEELERRRLARELHDEIGQSLTALGINLNFVRARISPDAEALIARLDSSLEQVERIADSTRDVMSALRPAELDDYGLAATLRSCARQHGQFTGNAIDVNCDDLSSRLSPETETALFRIAQESLTNVARHAGACHVVVTLEETSRGLRMSVEDDGVGYDVSAGTETDRRPAWGLKLMRERATAIGGELSVQSEPGKGTSVAVAINELD
jgi:two-component system sensor histidine kinase UhpB